MSNPGVMLHQCVIVAFDGANLLDIAGPLQALEASESSRDEPGRYATTVASMKGGEVRTGAGVPIVTRALDDIDPATIGTLIIAGGSAAGRPIVPAGLSQWVAALGARLCRICSICAGAFILAEAGLLRGRRATTHWHWAPLLQTEHPDVRVDPDSIYVTDGNVWTSAGVTAGIDMTLALIEQDHGHRVAVETARKLVVFMKRPGGQAQFSVPLLYQGQSGERFASLHAWMRANLTADLRIEALAEEAGMSPRSFSRRYGARTGRTPARAVEAMRIEAACGLLESTGMPVKQVAAAVGFGDEQALRRAFLRRFGVSPAAYRARFGS